MLKAYKFRLNPNSSQAELINKTIGSARFVYNSILHDNLENYKETKKSLFPQPTKYKKEFEWLKEIDSLALANARINVQTAFNNFFKNLKKGKLGFPKFKSKHSSKQSYQTNNQGGNIRVEDSKIKLPKLGFVNFVEHRKIEGEIRSVTISRNPSGKYYVSVLTEQAPKITHRLLDEKKVLGIDFSMGENFCVDSEGTKTKFPKFYYDSQKILKKYQSRLSKKQKGSKNREKERIKVALIHEKISNQRNDFLHKLSHSIAEQWDVVVVEDINLAGMKKHRNWGKRVSDSGFGMFRTFLEYKMKERLKSFVKADRFFPSSQLCSSCGYQNKDTKDLSLRLWACPSCGANHDRDVNASINLKNYIRREPPESKPVELKTSHSSSRYCEALTLKQEALAFRLG